MSVFIIEISTDSAEKMCLNNIYSMNIFQDSLEDKEDSQEGSQADSLEDKEDSQADSQEDKEASSLED